MAVPRLPPALDDDHIMILDYVDRTRDGQEFTRDDLPCFLARTTTPTSHAISEWVTWLTATDLTGLTVDVNVNGWTASTDSTNPGIVIPVAGNYWVGCRIHFADNLLGSYRAIEMMYNGLAIGASAARTQIQPTQVAANGGTQIQAVAPLTLAVGDVMNFRTYTTTTSLFTPGYEVFWAYWASTAEG